MIFNALDRITLTLFGETQLSKQSPGVDGARACRSALSRLKLAGWVSGLWGVVVMACCVGTELRAAVAEGRVVITEVMAANRSTVADEDRQPSDWIELLNVGGAPVNLGGWSLTDDSGQPQKWVFPEVTIQSGEYKLVFASGKNRRDPAKELHTSFKLDVGGEYLGLYRPDGKTVASAFKPSLPPLRPDVSYGFPVVEESTVYIPTNSLKLVKIPTADPGVDWIQPGFMATGWLTGKGGLGFDRGTNLLPWIGADLTSVMASKSAVCLVRVPFQAQPTLGEQLVLRMRYNDGFVAWLNGREVARRNAGPDASWKSTATGSRSAVAWVPWAEDFELDGERFALMNQDPGGRARVSTSTPETNRFLRLVNGRLPDQVNGVAMGQAIGSPARQIQLEFEYRIKGQAAVPTDFYVAFLPVKDFGPRGPGAGLTAFRNGREATIPGGLVVHFEVNPMQKENRWFVYQDGRMLTEQVVTDRSFAWRFYHRARMELRYTPEGLVMGLRVLTDVRGGTGKELVLADGLKIPGVKPYASRLQFAAHTRNTLVTVDLDSVKSQWLPEGDSITEDIDISATGRGLMVAGTNVLSILGLNRAAQDQDFLVDAEMYGYSKRLRLDSPRYFTPSTPLASNGDSEYAVIAPTPKVSVKSAVFSSPTAVELSLPKAVAGAKIYYTLDGEDPTQASTLYTKPISISSSVQLRAVTVAPGCLVSEPMVENYSMVEDGLGGFSSNLPILVLNSQGRARGNRKVGVSAQLIAPPAGGRAKLVGTPAQFSGIGDFNVRGFSSTRYPKRSFTLRLRDTYGEKQKVGLLDLPKESDWVLLAPYPDKTLMRDVIAYELSAASGHYAPRCRFVELFLNNGGGSVSSREYMGVYVLIEKIKRGKNRVNIQELAPEDNTAPQITGGYILKRDHSNDESPTFYALRGGEMYLVEPDSKDITASQREYIEGYFHRVERSIYGKNFMDPSKGYRAFLDVGSFIDQHWLIEMSKNIDGFRYSVYFSKDRGGKLKLEPAWDWNLSFGNANYLDGESPRGWYTDELRDSEICWYRKLSEDPEFKQEATDRWWELRRTVFSPERIGRRIDELAAQLNEAQERNFRRWPILGEHVHPNAYVGGSYADEIQYMKKWIAQRIAWIDGNFIAPPSVVTKKGADPASGITIKAKSGQIYYTLDGTDPRATGGEASAAAKVYASPVAPKDGQKVVARARSGDQWSAPLRL